MHGMLPSFHFPRLAPAIFLGFALTLPAAADPVVVELFTSQGCSTCPPADAMLGELIDRDGVIALSLHVDYWDWIGWKDTFADPAYSSRQRDYAAVARSNVVYTPQFVVGGTDQLAGPTGMELSELVARHEGVTGDVLRVASTAQGREVMAMATEGAGGLLILVNYLPEATVRVLRGENAGKDITYYNVVRSWSVLSRWDGGEASVIVPPAPPGQRQAVIAQAQVAGRPGPIRGAVLID